MIERRGKPLMVDQVAIFEVCQELLGEGGEEGWEALESTSKDIEMSMKYFPSKKGERSIGTGKAVGVVDSSAEEVAAWVMDFCNNERMRISTHERNPARLELREKARVNKNTAATVKKMPFVLSKREFVFRQIWKSEEGKVMIAIVSVDDEVDYGVKLKKTRGLTRGLWQLEDFPVRGGAKQCRVTVVTQLDARGSIPTWLMDKKMPEALGVVQDAIDEFRPDEKVDAAELREKSTFIRERWQDEVYSEEENGLLERACQKFEGSLKEGTDWKQLKSPDIFVKMEATFEEKCSSAAIGRAVTVVWKRDEEGFLEGYDVMKADVLTNHESHWAPIREKVEAWVRAGWKNWEQDKPEWYTDNWKAIVPKEMIPTKKRSEEVTEAREENMDIVVTGQEKQGSGRKSLLGGLVNRKSNYKVAPEGVKKGNYIDVEEFIRVMNRRGTELNM
ncbi:hypothetical protein TrLO_g3008 [Triparma laevis f. longispina]|uniref:START domain-containing protein n=1 Tax=Triparma laevis f. longispina TaxID=1714387 RepID=A0A9W7F5R9_9STRA|nr:hypothetical protein TrLO_g3008 [Triparma laevis f. longispina]